MESDSEIWFDEEFPRDGILNFEIWEGLRNDRVY